VSQKCHTNKDRYRDTHPSDGPVSNETKGSTSTMKTMYRKALVAIAAVGALGAVGAASASAHHFTYTAVGNILRVSNTTQVFTTKSGGPVVECTGDSVVKGNNSEGGSATNLHLEVAYTSCQVKFALFTFPASVSNAKYLFNAELWANLENAVTVEVPSAGCTITMPAQENLKPITYENKGTDLNFNLKFEKVKSKGSGGECGTGESTTGTYAGTTLVELRGGAIGWS
jgi:hypothetical protein